MLRFLHEAWTTNKHDRLLRTFTLGGILASAVLLAIVWIAPYLP